MKRYLITGALAFALCTLFNSCKETNEFDGNNIVEAKMDAFDKMFVETYGEIAPDHDWGFGTSAFARTRSANTDAGLWCKTYDVPQPLTANQKDIVRQYFQQVQDPEDEGFNYTDFFVQDVYKGGTKAYPTDNNAKTTETHYTAYGNPNGAIGNTPEEFSGRFYGSNQMDQLSSAGAGGVGNEHISNYNNAHCSPTGNVKYAGVYRDDYTPWTPESAAAAGKPWANAEEENFNGLKSNTDEIILMENCSTAYFGYNNSRQSSNKYNDMFKRVSGNTIMAWARKNNITVPSDGDVSGMHFVGFDYEADFNHGSNNTTNGNEYLVTEVTENTPGAFQIPNKQNDGDWQKGKWYIAGARDHYYSDWIIRVVDGHGESGGGGGDTPTTPQVMVVTSTTTSSSEYKVYKSVKVTDIGRVMAEDLGSSNKNDMDYNDVVFEARIIEDYYEVEVTSDGTTTTYTTGNYTVNNKSYTAGYSNARANIKLLAAGGTIPIQVAGINVHDAFGNVGKTTMINTYNPEMTNGMYVTLPATDLMNGSSYDFAITSIDAIPIAATYSNEVLEIKNEQGKVPHKIRVPAISENGPAPWPIERVEMNTAYDGYFGYGLKGDTGETKEGYVQKKDIPFWDHAVGGKVKNLDGFGTPIGTTIGERIEEASEQINGNTTYSSELQEALNSTIGSVESGWSTVWTRGNDNGYLYYDGTYHYVTVTKDQLSNVNVGTKIRIYGVSRSGWSINTRIGDATSYTNNNGYVEFTLTNDNIKNTGLDIYGNLFTVVRVDILPATSGRKGTVIWPVGQDPTSKAIAWGDGLVLDTSRFTGATTGTKIRVYGYGKEDGDQSWQVKFGQNVDGWPNVPGTSEHTYWTKGNVEGDVELEWTLTSEGASAVLANQTVFYGPNFTIYYVTIE